MATFIREGGVTFIWAIENFDPTFFGNLYSPVFSFDSTKWMISMYPKGQNNDGDSIALVLTRCCAGNEIDHNKIILDCELALIKENGSSLVSMEIKNHGFTTDHSWSPCQNFVSRDEVFEKRSEEFIPYNVLHIRCRMWRKSRTLSELHWKHTKIERRYFVWKITNFSSLRKNQMKATQIEKALSETSTLTFNFHLTRRGGVVIEIESHESSKCVLFCEIAVMDYAGRISSDMRFFCVAMNPVRYGVQTWEFPTFVTIGELLKNRNLYLPKDVLSLRVDCFVWERNTINEYVSHIPMQTSRVLKNDHRSQDPSSRRNTETELAIPTNGRESKMENIPRKCDKQCMTEMENTVMTHKKEPSNVNPTTHSLECFVHDIHSIYEEGLLSDFTLCAGNRTFPVHKSILSARSPVFKAMFTTPLKEKDGKTLNIPDIDGETLHRMLLFVYSNEIEELEWEEALNLYFAADKYNIKDLKKLTRSILKSGLSVSNVCEVMVHADLHEDSELKSSAMEFIVANDQEIIGTDDWIKFQKKYIHLTMEILSVLYTVVRKRID